MSSRPHVRPLHVPQVITSSVVLRKLMEGRQGEASLGGGSADVATRCAPACLQQLCRCLLPCMQLQSLCQLACAAVLCSAGCWPAARPTIRPPHPGQAAGAGAQVPGEAAGGAAAGCGCAARRRHRAPAVPAQDAPRAHVRAQPRRWAVTWRGQRWPAGAGRGLGASAGPTPSRLRLPPHRQTPAFPRCCRRPHPQAPPSASTSIRSRRSGTSARRGCARRASAAPPQTPPPPMSTRAARCGRGAGGSQLQRRSACPCSRWPSAGLHPACP